MARALRPGPPILALPEMRASGQGYRGFFTMPRLAGQTTEYTENQLRAYVEGRRESHIALRMSKVHGLSPEMRTVLATHFRDLNPKPFGGAPREFVGEGKKSLKREFPTPMFLRALPVTVQRLRVAAQILA